VVEVDERDRYEEGDEHEPEHERRGVVRVHDGDGGEQRRGEGLDDRVAAGDRLRAAAAAAPQQQPRQHRDVVARCDGGVAGGAVRARVRERLAARQAVGDDVQKRPDEEAEGGGGGKGGGHKTGVLAVGVRSWGPYRQADATA
jgi:hypothetical protein